jgi:hypothetical protein
VEAEVDRRSGTGESVEHDVTEWTRGERLDLASLGLSTAKGKTILADIQTQMVAVQVEHNGDAHRCCGKCGQKLLNKGHYRSTFRSLYGNVPVQVRCVKACLECARKSGVRLLFKAEGWLNPFPLND